MVRHQTGIDVVLIYLDLNDVSTWDKRLSFIGHFPNSVWAYQYLNDLKHGRKSRFR